MRKHFYAEIIYVDMFGKKHNILKSRKDELSATKLSEKMLKEIEPIAKYIQVYVWQTKLISWRQRGDSKMMKIKDPRSIKAEGKI